jgi:two-component system LytT family response regulator
VDYLLKPVNPEKLADAVDRVQKIVQATFNTQLSALRENLDPVNTTNKKLVLKTLENIYLVNSRDIIQCRSDDCYSIIETVEGEKIMVSRVLKEFDEMLSDHGFFRVHRSHLVNLRHIKRFIKQEGGYVMMANNDKIPVSSRSRERLLRLFEEMEGN